jgi:hypothetical protein
MIAQVKQSVRVDKNVNTGHVDSIIREYKQTRWAPNSDRIGKSDSLSAWYSIEDIENFINSAKANGGDGIKFYFAAYPEDYASTPEYAGRQTLAMVATKSKLTEMGKIANKDIYVSKNGRTKILSGIIPPTLCPPICGATEGGMGDLGITLVDRGEKGMEII